MKKTLIGIVTFGNLPFTKLAVKGIRNTVTLPYELCLIIGKSTDTDTLEWVKGEGIEAIYHADNYGFPYSINDLYDVAWKDNNFDYFIIMGNDVIPYPYAIDSLIKVASENDYVWISANQYDVRSLIRDFPECQSQFQGGHCVVSDLSTPSWEMFTGYSDEIVITTPGMSDIHNLALYKKHVFDTIGYVDVNFFPAYYSDNDYARRGVNAGLRPNSCTLTNAVYFHFWSRTIHQGNNIDSDKHHSYFGANSNFYQMKWGGGFGSERHGTPFNGKQYALTPTIMLEPSLNIASRDNEKEIIDFWR